MDKKKLYSILSAVVVIVAAVFGISIGTGNNTAETAQTTDNSYTEQYSDSEAEYSSDESSSDADEYSEDDYDNTYSYQSESDFNYDEETSTVSLADAPTFRSESLLEQHYEKHGIEMGFDSAEDYQTAAQLVVMNENALHKTEAEDGDDIYYLVDTNEFVIVSTDGYIRTYFYPSAGLDYYNRQ